MKQRYYAANNGKAILQIITTLGQNDLQISVGNNKLDWYQIELNSDQVSGLVLWLRNNNVGEWE